MAAEKMATDFSAFHSSMNTTGATAIAWGRSDKMKTQSANPGARDRGRFVAGFRGRLTGARQDIMVLLASMAVCAGCFVRAETFVLTGATF